jgi:hypothetical protein
VTWGRPPADLSLLRRVRVPRNLTWSFVHDMLSLPKSVNSSLYPLTSKLLSIIIALEFTPQDSSSSTHLHEDRTVDPFSPIATFLPLQTSTSSCGSILPKKQQQQVYQPAMSLSSMLWLSLLALAAAGEHLTICTSNQNCLSSCRCSCVFLLVSLLLWSPVLQAAAVSAALQHTQQL